MKVNEKDLGVENDPISSYNSLRRQAVDKKRKEDEKKISQNSNVNAIKQFEFKMC